MVQVHFHAVDDPPQQMLRNDEARNSVGKSDEDRIDGAAGHGVADLLPPTGQTFTAEVEWIGAVGDVVTAAGEGIKGLHSAALLDRQQPVDTSEIGSRAPGNAVTGAKTGF